MLGLGLVPTDEASFGASLLEPRASGQRASRGMPEGTARSIAVAAHRGQTEPSGRPYIDHVGRVAISVPSEAASVAWLHDVLERSTVSEESLAALGLAPHERTALRLLTHLSDSGERDDAMFFAHVRTIAAAPGSAGRIARAVKRADMEDRMQSPRDPTATWQPPYALALTLIAREEVGR